MRRIATSLRMLASACSPPRTGAHAASKPVRSRARSTIASGGSSATASLSSRSTAAAWVQRCRASPATSPGGSASTRSQLRSAAWQASRVRSSIMNRGERSAPTRAMWSSGSASHASRLVRSRTSWRVKKPAPAGVTYGTPWLSSACSNTCTLASRRSRTATSRGAAARERSASASHTGAPARSRAATSRATASASTRRRSASSPPEVRAIGITTRCGPVQAAGPRPDMRCMRTAPGPAPSVNTRSNSPLHTSTSSS